MGYSKDRKRRKRKRSKASLPENNGAGDNSADESNQPPRGGKKRKLVPNEPHPGIPRHAFDVVETDHCETPLQAYKDIVKLLEFIAKSLKKTRDRLQIYDPYYCDGGVSVKLGSLGFENVINRNEDFYRMVEKGDVPDHDVIVTNPPYSGNHLEKLLSFVANHRKPYLMLLPHFVYTKDYYETILGGASKSIFYLVPQKRYSYFPPTWVSQSTGSTALGKGKLQTAPFPSFWYCRVPSMSEGWLSKTLGPSGKYDPKRKLHFAKCTQHIPRESKGEFDSTKKRPNPRARKRSAAKKRKALGSACS